MGQLITVVEKPTSRPDVVRFDLNRSLTGMSHEQFAAGSDVKGDRPVDELARRLLARPGVEMVHAYSNVVTVELAPGATSDGLADIIHGLFTYYVEGVTPAEV
jgi:hypothetical protein